MRLGIKLEIGTVDVGVGMGADVGVGSGHGSVSFFCCSNMTMFEKET